MIRRAKIAILAGLLPVFAVNIALLMNINTGLEACFPYWEGCYSVSRGIRSGPGLLVFKILAWPSAFLMSYCWWLSRDWLDGNKQSAGRSGKLISWSGMLGAVFFLVYANWLGSEGDIYQWLRRYGVVFYFGLTALAQLGVASVIWNARKNARYPASVKAGNIYLGVMFLSWLLGVSSAFKRKLIDNPDFLDRVENLLEWNFALLLSLAFVALGWLFRAEDLTSAKNS